MKQNTIQSILLTTIFSAFFLVSCGDTKTPDNGATNLPKDAKGGKVYGGVFKLNETEYIKSLYPLSIIDVYSLRTATQIYEGLLKFKQDDLSLMPALAESYSVDETKTIYTFVLRKGVLFHDNECFSGGKGREMTAEDVKYCFTRTCTQDAQNQGFSVFQDVLKGANEYYKASAGGKKPSFEVEGLKVIDKNTIQLTLNQPSAVFLYGLAKPFTFIYPKEAVEKYGSEMRTKAVGTGAFTLASLEENNSIILKRNPKYYQKDKDGNVLPFLEAIKITFIKDKKTELFEFQKGNLDMVYRLPTDYITEATEKAAKAADGGIQDFDLQRNPEMTTQYLYFMTKNEVFKDLNVRKAFSFAIDRQKILDYALGGEGEAAGEHGITPPTFKNYDISKIRGYGLNIDSAKYYFEKAGFSGGKGFPLVTLELNAEGNRQTDVAQEIQKQLKDHLNINIKINIMPIAQLLDNGFAGKFNMLKTSYYADYPSAENFLSLFLGKFVPDNDAEKSIPNMARFKNAKYDALYAQAVSSKSEEEANELFAKAEQILMDNAPIIVLWYDEAYRLVKMNVKDFPNNAMQWRDFSGVYLKK